MIKPEQIPDEAVERAIEIYGNYNSMRFAIAAALNAWPGASTENREVMNFGNNIDGPVLSVNRASFTILPSPQEDDPD